MQYKLNEYIGDYKKITIEQKKAIDKQDIDLLNSLIARKNNIIDKITDCINSGIKYDNKTRENIKEIVIIEKGNMKKLKLNQQSIRKEINLIKKRQNGLNSYRKNTAVNFFGENSLNV